MDVNNLWEEMVKAWFRVEVVKSETLEGKEETHNPGKETIMACIEIASSPQVKDPR